MLMFGACSIVVLQKHTIYIISIKYYNRNLNRDLLKINILIIIKFMKTLGMDSFQKYQDRLGDDSIILFFFC